MKILVISNMYPSDTYPHFGTFVARITNGMRCAGADCQVVAIRQESGSFSAKAFRYFNFYCKAILACLFGSYDVVYVHFPSHSFFPVALTRFFRKEKLVIHFHGSDAFRQSNSSKFFHAIKSYVNSLACASSFCVVSPSYSYAKYLKKRYPRKISKLVVSPSGGVDTNFFNYKKRGYGTKLKILFVARMVSVKRPLMFAEYIKEMLDSGAEVEVTIVGSGFLYSFVKEKLNIHPVNFFSSLSQLELVEVYSMHDVIVQTSENESLGLVALEGMATGCIPVCSSIPAFCEFIKDGKNGFLFENKASFFRCIYKLSAMSNHERLAISKAARESVVQSYSSEIVSERLYDEIS